MSTLQVSDTSKSLVESWFSPESNDSKTKQTPKTSKREKKTSPKSAKLKVRKPATEDSSDEESEVFSSHGLQKVTKIKEKDKKISDFMADKVQKNLSKKSSPAFGREKTKGLSGKKRKQVEKTALNVSESDSENESKVSAIAKKKKMKIDNAVATTLEHTPESIEDILNILKNKDIPRNRKRKLRKKLKKMQEKDSKSDENEKEEGKPEVSKSKKKRSKGSDQEGTPVSKKKKQTSAGESPMPEIIHPSSSPVPSVEYLRLRLEREELSRTTKKRLRKRLNSLLKSEKGSTPPQPNLLQVKPAAHSEKSKSPIINLAAKVDQSPDSSDDDISSSTSTSNSDEENEKLGKKKTISPQKRKALEEKKKLMSLNKSKFTKTVLKLNEDEDSSGDSEEMESESDNDSDNESDDDSEFDEESSEEETDVRQGKSKANNTKNLQMKNKKQKLGSEKQKYTKVKANSTPEKSKITPDASTSPFQKKKRNKKRSKQKNIKKDNRPEHKKPIHLQSTKK